MSVEAGTYVPRNSRTVYVWPEDEDMPEGFKYLSNQRRDEAVLWDADRDESVRNGNDEAVSVSRGEAVVVDSGGTVVDRFALDDEAAVKEFLDSHEKDSGSLDVPGLADEDGSESAVEPVPAPVEGTDTATVPGRPSGLSDEEWQLVQDSRNRAGDLR